MKKSVKATDSGRKPGKLGRATPRVEPTRFSYQGNRPAQLRAFLATAKLGSLSRAAQALSLSQPSISLQLSALERELGCSLLTRGRRRRIGLTTEGQALFELARPLIDGLDGIDAQFRSRPIKDDDADELRIAAGATAIRHLLPALIDAYRGAHPKVRVQLRHASSEEGLALLRSGDVELAFGSWLDVAADTQFTRMIESDPMLITPRDHPLANKKDVQPRDIAAYGLILPAQRRSSYRLIDLMFRQHGLSFHVALETADWESIKQCVAMGFGISIASALCLSDVDRERFASHNLRAHFPPRTFGVIARRHAQHSQSAQALLEMIESG